MKLIPLAVSVPQAAILCGLSRAKLYQFIRSGDLKIRKCGSRTLIRYEDLQELIDSFPSPQNVGGSNG